MSAVWTLKDQPHDPDDLMQRLGPSGGKMITDRITYLLQPLLHSLNTGNSS
jgi:hypothetical protein